MSARDAATWGASASARTVTVTRVQRRAAQAMVRRLEDTGRPISAALRKISMAAVRR